MYSAMLAACLPTLAFDTSYSVCCFAHSHTYLSLQLCIHRLARVIGANGTVAGFPSPTHSGWLETPTDGASVKLWTIPSSHGTGAVLDSPISPPGSGTSSSVLHCTALHCTALYCTVLYCTVLYCTVLYCTVLYCTVLYCTVLYCTVQHYTDTATASGETTNVHVTLIGGKEHARVNTMAVALLPHYPHSNRKAVGASNSA